MARIKVIFETRRPGVYLKIVLMVLIATLVTSCGDGSGSKEMKSSNAKSPEITIKDSDRANPDDIVQARSLLISLPQACSNSSARVKLDGTVEITVRCRKEEMFTYSEILIKDGIVKEIN